MEHKLNSMDTLFHNSYYKYFRWNKGLVEYYLSDKSSYEDVKLYVDAVILARIGRKMEVGDYSEDKEYVDDFMESVNCFCNYYNKYDNYYSCPLELPEDPKLKNDPKKAAMQQVSCTNAKKLKKCGHPNKFCVPMQCYELENSCGCDVPTKAFEFARPDFLAIAKHISCKECILCKEICKESDEFNDENKKKCLNEGITYYHKYYDQFGNMKIKMDNGKAEKFDLPFFSIVVYIILRFGEKETLQWNNLTDRIYAKKEVDEDDQTKTTLNKSYLKIAVGSRPYINDLWVKIHCYNKRFNKDAVVYDSEPYAGKIKYHLPLSAPIQRKLKDAIYKTDTWRYYMLPFEKKLNYLESSLSDTKANKELKDLFQRIWNSKDFQNAEAQKVREIIEHFNVEDYENKLEERKTNEEYLQTIIKGKFALAIHFTKDNDNDDTASIILLTTVQQEIIGSGYEISQGTEDTIGTEEYNVNPVIYRGSKEVDLEDHKLFIKGVCQITQIKTEDVVFFYRFNYNEYTGESYYIQTREIVKGNPYFVAVRNNDNAICNFEEWCKSNDNNFEKYDLEESQYLFGNGWIVYYSDKSLNGQFYDATDIVSDIGQLSVSTIDLGGGIKNKDGEYFINALPYIFIPNDLNVSIKIEICESYDSWLFIWDSCQYTHQKNRIIVDFTQMPQIGEGAFCKYTISHDSEEISLPKFPICNQKIQYDQNVLYKFDELGHISDDQYVLSGNTIVGNHFSKPSGGYMIQDLTELTETTESMYLVNLLAAKSYNCEAATIKTGKDQDFEKCLDYAKTRVDIPEYWASKNIKDLLSATGYININYEKGECQIIPPAFTKIPRSLNWMPECQLILLSGCYTRKFINDLLVFCNDNNVKVYHIPNKIAILPPTILLGHNFNPNEFIEKYKHQCDVLLEQDLALSLLNCVPSTTTIFNSFSFSYRDDYFITHLQPLEKENEPHPRIRKDKNRRPNWYIELKGNLFADIDKNMISWAFLYCYMEQEKTVVINHQNKLYIPSDIGLPTLIRRSLYLMNLIWPKTIKAFVCNSHTKDKYYSLINVYELFTEERCQLFIKKLAGINNEYARLFRKQIMPTKKDETFRMEYWKERRITSKTTKKYLVLQSVVVKEVLNEVIYDKEEICAVGYNSDAYIFCGGRLRKVEGNMNEVLSLLIMTDVWRKKDNENILERLINGKWEEFIQITDETIELPSKSEFEIEELTIL